MQHLTSLIALLGYKFIANGQHTGKAGLNNLVEMLSILALNRLVSKSTAYSQQTLETSQDGACIVGVEELHSEVHKSGPAAREVALENTLENGDELLSNKWLGLSQNGNDAIADAGFFIFGYRGLVGLVFDVPSTVDTILDINDG